VSDGRVWLYTPHLRPVQKLPALQGWLPLDTGVGLKRGTRPPLPPRQVGPSIIQGQSGVCSWATAGESGPLVSVDKASRAFSFDIVVKANQQFSVLGTVNHRWSSPIQKNENNKEPRTKTVVIGGHLDCCGNRPTVEGKANQAVQQELPKTLLWIGKPDSIQKKIDMGFGPAGSY